MRVSRAPVPTRPRGPDIGDGVPLAGAALPPQNSGDAARRSVAVGGGALDGGHLSAGLESTLDDPLGQSRIGGRIG